MERDAMAYGHDLSLVQESRVVANDVAWHRSAAAKLLKKDVDEGRNKIMTPLQLWLDRNEYKEFELEVFRKHIYQEVDSRPKRDIRFKKKKKRWKYPELHQEHPRMLEGFVDDDGDDSSSYYSNDTEDKDDGNDSDS